MHTLSCNETSSVRSSCLLCQHIPCHISILPTIISYYLIIKKIIQLTFIHNGVIICALKYETLILWCFLHLFYTYNGCFLNIINHSLHHCHGNVFVYSIFATFSTNFFGRIGKYFERINSFLQ